MKFGTRRPPPLPPPSSPSPHPPKQPTPPASNPAPTAQRSSAPARKPKAEELPDRAHELLAQIRAGTLPGKALGPEARRAVVQLLVADGVSGPEIAQIIKVADRTIERDRQILREENAVVKDPALVARMVGHLMFEANLATQRIRRSIRDKDVPPQVKVDGEHRCFQIQDALTDRLQKLAYLPTAAQRVDATLSCQPVEPPTEEDIQAEYQRLADLGKDHVDQAELDIVADFLARAVTASHLEQAQLPAGKVVAESPAQPARGSAPTKQPAKSNTQRKSPKQ